MIPNFVIDVNSKNVFFRCVEDCSEAIMLTDVQGKLFYVNPAWCSIYGYTKEEALGQSPKLLHSGYQEPEFYRKMWTAIVDPSLGSWKGELINRAKDGQLVPVLLTITALRNNQGSIVGHMGIALDMSAQRQLEAKVLQQDRLASIGILSSGLAHEIGTPLGVVRGRAEFLMMKAEAAKDTAVAGGLQVIVSQIDRISKLIKSLLRFSRATDDVRTQEIELMTVINEVVNLLGDNLRANSIELKLDIHNGMKVQADFNRLQQIFLNLIVNSIHAIQKAKLECKPRAHEIRISATIRQNGHTPRVCIEVADTGCGISPENMRRLFQPFFTTKDVGQGTGLGLAIVSKLITEMRGDISVDSALGKGTCFMIGLNASA